jgi:pantoate--beta-alanine ligase
MEVIAEIQPLRAFIAGQRKLGKRIVFVPTMGALHDGHRACIDTGRAVEDGTLVVSIFINPAQFGPGEDLEEYPRALDEDLARCRMWGCGVVFAPRTEVMYPKAQKAWVHVEGLSEPLCGRSRPGHFRGVTTVVAKLFNIVRPDVAVFGQKDAQQALVIREMVDQLDMQIQLVVAPTAREPTGLARSSRNQYLDDSQRRRAASIYHSLQNARDRLRAGERDPRALVAGVESDLVAGGVDDVEYVDVVKAVDLSSLERIEGKVILAIAARVGATRLIDNMVLHVGAGGNVEETTLF